VLRIRFEKRVLTILNIYWEVGIHMKTFMAKAGKVDQKWFAIDAEGMRLGRLASQIAVILSGKNKPIYTPHVDTGDYVIVYNAEKVVLTGDKLEKKFHRYHTGHIGGLKEIKYKFMMENKPEQVIELAVKGMLPKNSLGRKMFKKLKVYKGDKHSHQAQNPEKYEV
jgi:large subunit ribosomal protein L13